MSHEHLSTAVDPDRLIPCTAGCNAPGIGLQGGMISGDPPQLCIALAERPKSGSIRRNGASAAAWSVVRITRRLGDTPGARLGRRDSTRFCQARLHCLSKRTDVVVGLEELAQAGVREYRVLSRPEADEQRHVGQSLPKPPQEITKMCRIAADIEVENAYHRGIAHVE